MRRRTFLGTLAGGLLAAPLAAEAQAGRVAHIGFLGTTNPSSAVKPLEMFREGLRERGYVEGSNVVMEYRWADGRAERLPSLAAELVQLKVDVLFAPTLPAAIAAKDATRSIPIVMAIVGDPVRTGLVASLARPGGNMTGVCALAEQLNPKQLEMLKEAVPGITGLGVLWNPANPAHDPALKAVESAAPSLGMRPLLLEVRDPNEFESAFQTMVRGRTGGLLVLEDPMFFFHRMRITDLAARHRVPAIYSFKEYVEAGGLMSYAASLSDLLRRAAGYIDKILRGTKPPDLPVEQPTKFELVINLKTAKALGLTIPPSLLARADQVIE